MAGKLVVNTINTDTANAVFTTQNAVTGIPKAWVNFNGTGTVAIRDSFNVSSITDNGTGDYTVNFTTAMPNANYAAVAMGVEGSGTSGGFGAFIFGPQSYQTTSSVRVMNCSHVGALYDGDAIRVVVLSS